MTKLEDLKAGYQIEVDEGFECTGAGTKTVFKDGKGLYFICSHGTHYLDGQLDDNGNLIGVKKL